MGTQTATGMPKRGDWGENAIMLEIHKHKAAPLETIVSALSSLFMFYSSSVYQDDFVQRSSQSTLDKP